MDRLVCFYLNSFKFYKTSKIEKVLNNYQRQNTIKRGKDENYPFISFIIKSKKDEKIINKYNKWDARMLR